MSTESPNVQWPEDFGHQSEDVGDFVLGVRNDNDIPLTDTDLDYSPIAVDSAGAVKVVSGDTPLEIRSLDCELDSVTICPPASGIFQVELVDCCPHHMSGFCLDDGTPIIIVVQENVQTGWINTETGIFTVGAPPVGTVLCAPSLDCSKDSITVCPPVSGVFNVEVTGTVFTKRDVTGRLGTYHIASPDSLLTSAADPATGGRWWLVNTSSSVLVKLIEVRFTCHLTNLLDLGTAVPEISMERMTFTGTPSGATVTPAKRDSVEPNNTGTFRTVSTGMVITAGAAIKRFIPVTLSVIGGILSANTAALSPTEQLFQPRDDSGDIVLRQGEGIVWRQSTVGTGNEQRSVQIDLIWEEFEI